MAADAPPGQASLLASQVDTVAGASSAGALPVASSTGHAEYADQVPAGPFSRLPTLQPHRAVATTENTLTGSVTFLDCPAAGVSYQLGKTLAECLMGKVKLAQKFTLTAADVRQDTGVAVAIKIMLKSCIRGKVTRDGRRVAENPEEEIQAMLFLGAHPYLLNLQTLATDEQHVFLVMDLAPGGDLFGKVSQSVSPPSRLAENEAKRVFHQLVMGVQYMHARGIVHRDLSLENVMLDAQENVKIIDFGLMKQVKLPAGGPLAGQRVGKGGYMPPEVYQAQALGDARSVDVWCMGVMLFIMLFGVPPYRSADARQCRLFAELAAGRLQRLLKHWQMDSYASAEAKDLVIRMLSPKAADRPTLVQVLAHPWLAALHAEAKYTVFPGTDHDELVQWLEAATIESQAVAGQGYLSSSTVGSAPGWWGVQWRNEQGATPAAATAASAAAAPPKPSSGEWGTSSPVVVLPTDVSALPGGGGGNGAAAGGLRISARPQDEDGDIMG